MSKAVNRIKEAWEENPLTVIIVASGAAVALSKLITSVSEARNTRTWAKEVRRRDRMIKKSRLR